MAFIDEIKERAKADKKTIVLPESMDKRTFEAAEKILKEGIANLIIIGTPEEIAEAALQDDVKVVALSLLSGAHNTLFPKVVELMRAKGLNDVLVIGGGVIPDTDIPGLKAAGVAEVFTPGTPTGNIVDFINANTH